MRKRLYINLMSSPVGDLKLIVSDKGLVAVTWSDSGLSWLNKFELIDEATHPLLQQTITELEEYFAKKRRKFSLPLDMNGTDFQKEVWQALVAIPYGETRSYKQIAELIKRPKAYRAVGLANNKNPIAIIAACHRVIGSDGKLVGYAGGLWAKELLLKLEQ